MTHWIWWHVEYHANYWIYLILINCVYGTHNEYMRIDLRAEKKWTLNIHLHTASRLLVVAVNCVWVVKGIRKKCFAVDMRSQFELYLYLIYWSALNIIIQTSHNSNNNRYCLLALRSLLHLHHPRNRRQEKNHRHRAPHTTLHTS